jgi:hypothetical protein
MHATVRSRDGTTPLFRAIFGDKLDVVQYLLEHTKADLLVPERVGERRHCIHLVTTSPATAPMRQLVLSAAFRRGIDLPPYLLTKRPMPAGLPPYMMGAMGGFMGAFGGNRGSFVPKSDPLPDRAKADQGGDKEGNKADQGGGEEENKGGVVLSSRVSVLRDFYGAVVLNPEVLCPSEYLRLSEKPLKCGCKKRPSKNACPCQMAGRPCFEFCPAQCQRANPSNRLRLPSGKSVALSVCARDHLTTVRGLSEAQLEAKYRKACIERWGNTYGNHSNPKNLDVVLRRLLRKKAWEGCRDCGADGAQFFSFCFNRAVNADRVAHCMHCGRCFYFRPGFLERCSYCFKEQADQEYEYKNDMDSMFGNQAEAQMAQEGYWSY